MEKYKEDYNYWLNRYNNGIKYLEKNPKDFDKYLKNILKIREELDKIIEEHLEITSKEIFNGFK